jgi:uncharacterized protein YoxC
MKEKSNEKYVTEPVFVKATNGLKEKTDKLTEKTDELTEKTDELTGKTDALMEKMDALNEKIERVSLALVDTQARVRNIEETMATKNDVSMILNRIDHYAVEMWDFSRKMYVHDHRFNEMEPTLLNHESRITALEKKYQ